MNQTIIKILATLGLIVLTTGLIVAYASPSTGYELDIYASTPLLTWVFLGISLIIGAAIILICAISKDKSKRPLWMLGLFILILSRISILWVPYIRGYLTWDGDNISHWGILKDIISSGFLDSSNSYPVLHTLLSETVLLTNLQIPLVTNLSTALISIFYIFTVYLLSRAVLTDKSHQLMAVLVAGFIFVLGGYNVFLMPNGWSIFFIPLLFYLYFERIKRPELNIPFLIVLVLFPFFHPLSSLLVGISFLFIYLMTLLSTRWPINRLIPQNIILTRTANPLFPAMIQFAILLPWILSFSKFLPNIRSMWNQIISGSPHILDDITGTLSKINVTGFDTIFLFVKLYGIALFLIVLTLLGMAFIITKWRKKEISSNLFPLFIIGSVIIFFGFMYFLYLIGFPGMSAIGAQRLLSYVQVLAPIIAGYALWEIIGKAHWKKIITSSIVLLLLFSSFLSIRSLYHSPFVLRPNAQISHSVILGSSWFIENKHTSISTTSLLSSIYRYADGIIGRTETSNRKDLRSLQLSDHFGYDKYDTIGEQFSTPNYLTITAKDQIVYSTVWKIIGRFNELDFEKLRQDISTYKIYENNGQTIYFIK